MKESRVYFADVAENWDEMRAGYFTEAMRDAAIARANLPPGAVVADVGTGTGFMIQGLATRATAVYGFDESPEMLAIARRNLGTFSNVKLREARGDMLPIPDGSLDAVFGNMYLHHTPDPAAAIAELTRVLRPAGKLVLIDMDAHNQEWMREAMADRWLGFRRDDIRAWYAAAGLTDVAVECAQGDCRPATPGGEKLVLSIFVAYGQKG
ncbi:MAG: methyltransferase domain-containing protein [Candidatus Aminicenantes bacterium]|nr:MAG: methyltransferase domain-containing protein [Candidatus Aminicenantes bacterium]